MAHFEKQLSSEEIFAGRVIRVTVDKVELENGRPVLSTNVYELLEGFTGRRIDTQVLGKAFEPEEYFENPDGTPITFDQDYFGDHRGAHPLPGPFAGKDAVGQPLW